MLKKYKKFLALFSYLLAIAGLFLIVFHFQSRSENVAISDLKSKTLEEVEKSEKPVKPPDNFEDEKVQEAVLPEKFLLDVPFQSQAPFGDWSQPYQDGCEEASIIMVKRFLENKSLSKEEMKSEIDASVAWQEKNWGGHNDLDAERTTELANKYFDLSGYILRNYDLDLLKKYISSGTPIIAPTAGRELGNPNFTGAGPEYHMLVIVGYNDSQGVFITNDPGTRKGENYIYKYQTLLDAISGPNVNKEKAVIILSSL